MTADDTPRRILVVANETCGSPELCESVRLRAGTGAAQIRIVSPALTKSRLQFWVSDVDEARAEAEQRLRTLVSALEAIGLSADAAGVGDPDPLQAIEDELHEFPADEVVIYTGPSERTTWLEKEIVPRARDRFGIPVAHVEIGG